MAVDELPGSIDSRLEGLLVSPEGSDAVIRLSIAGEVDLSRYDELDLMLAEAVSRSESGLEIDLSQVTFMDSQGIRLLLRVRKELTGRGQRLVLLDPSPAILHLLDVTGLRTAFDIDDGRET